MLVQCIRMEEVIERGMPSTDGNLNWDIFSTPTISHFPQASEFITPATSHFPNVSESQNGFPD